MKQAIISTLIYADIFNFPLTKKEIKKRLIAPAVGDFDKSLKELEKKKTIKGKDGYYFLYGRERIIGLRKKREKEAEKKMKKAEEIADLLKLIPTLKFIGVTGNVAADNCRQSDDIDLFIISSKNWLWTTRFLVTVFLILVGAKRRVTDKNFADKICLNLFMDENHLGYPVKNLFVAYEIIQVRPVFDRGGVFKSFLKANSWVKNYLPYGTKYY